MAKMKKRAAAKRGAAQELDGVYLLKLALYVILGSLWIKLSHGADMNIPLPVGLIVGLLFASHEHFQLDRKIEYAILLVAMLVGYFAPYGLYISF
ncbi:MAG TPA: hypothetical protein VJP80_04260 [Candidatus Saccharimonadales bacterium]|nr:hypothetical protein [Candidatus Saccharimonadales bacterium]